MELYANAAYCAYTVQLPQAHSIYHLHWPLGRDGAEYTCTVMQSYEQCLSSRLVEGKCISSVGCEVEVREIYKCLLYIVSEAV